MWGLPYSLVFSTKSIQEFFEGEKFIVLKVRQCFHLWNRWMHIVVLKHIRCILRIEICITWIINVYLLSFWTKRQQSVDWEVRRRTKIFNNQKPKFVGYVLLSTLIPSSPELHGPYKSFKDKASIQLLMCFGLVLQ